MHANSQRFATYQYVYTYAYMNTYVYRYISDYLQDTHELATVREVYVYTHVHIHTYLYRNLSEYLQDVSESGPWEWGSWSMRMGFVVHENGVRHIYTRIYVEMCQNTCKTCQSPVHENGVRHTKVESEKSTSVYRGRAKIYRGGGAWDSRLHPWKPVRKFEDSRFQVFTGVPITYKFSRESPDFWPDSVRILARHTRTRNGPQLCPYVVDKKHLYTYIYGCTYMYRDSQTLVLYLFCIVK